MKGLTRPEGLNFDDWVWARISLGDLQDMSGIRFGKALHDRESPFSRPEALMDGPQIKVILRDSDLFL